MKILRNTNFLQFAAMAMSIVNIVLLSITIGNNGFVSIYDTSTNVTEEYTISGISDELQCNESGCGLVALSHAIMAFLIITLVAECFCLIAVLVGIKTKNKRTPFICFCLTVVTMMFGVISRALLANMNDRINTYYTSDNFTMKNLKGTVSLSLSVLLLLFNAFYQYCGTDPLSATNVLKQRQILPQMLHWLKVVAAQP